MEELTQLGLSRKRIFVKFLKENKIYDIFLLNTMNVRLNTMNIRSKYYHSINNIFNRFSLENITIRDFFLFSSAEYPKNISPYAKFTYWCRYEDKWVSYRLKNRRI